MIATARWVGFRLAAVAMIALGVALMWQHRAWFEPRNIQALLAHHPWAPLAFVLVHVVVSLVFIPRTVMAIAAGLIFGVWWGIVWTVVGSMAGSLAGFGLARALGGDRFGFSRLPRLAPVLARLERGGWFAVYTVRLLPFPHTPVNYAFGLTNISWGAYSWGSFLGVLPSAVVAVEIGAAGGSALGGASTGWILPAALGAAGVIVSLLVKRLFGRRREPPLTEGRPVA